MLAAHDPVDALARFVAEMQFADLPVTSTDAAKRLLLDAIAAGLAGSAVPGCAQIVGVAQDIDAGKPCSVLAFPGKAGLLGAVLANGTFIRAVDYDDIHETGVMRLSAFAVPIVLAIAEVRQVTGQELLAALVLGGDFACRLGLALNAPLTSSGFIPGTVFGALASAAIAAHLFRLDHERVREAIGIAYAQAAGNFQCFVDEAFTKHMQPALAARAGVLSALLAERGITGARNVLAGRHGAYHIYEHDRADLDTLTRGLGDAYEIESVSLKPYPVLRWIHGAVDGALALYQRYAIRHDQIERVVVRMKSRFYDLCCTPLEAKRRPTTAIGAEFSLPFVVASAFVHGSVDLDDFETACLKDSRVLALADRVEPIADSALDPIGEWPTGPVVVDVSLKDGRRYSHHVENALGSPANPLSFDDLKRKLTQCNTSAAHPVSPNRLTEGVAMIADLEQIDDAGRVIRSFTGVAGG